MSAAPARRIDERAAVRDSRELVRTLAVGGLATFWSERLTARSPARDALGAALTRRVADLGLGEAASWDALAGRIGQLLPEARGPLASLARDYRLSLADIFLLGLVGEVESDFRVTLAVAELQAPDQSGRPCLHLVSELLLRLFDHGEAESTALQALPLVRDGILAIEGEAPLPQCTLRIRPELWAVLSGAAPWWPGCCILPHAETDLLATEMAQQIDGIAGCMQDGSVAGVVLRGPPLSGRAVLAAALAKGTGRRAIEVPLERWRTDPALPVACTYGGLLPILRLVLESGAAATLPPVRGYWGPIVVLLGQDGAVEASRLMEVSLPRPRSDERRQLWRRFLGEDEVAAAVSEVALLPGPAIRAVAHDARLMAGRRGEALEPRHVLAARRHVGADALRSLAQSIERDVPRAALVMPAALRDDLDAFIRRCRSREALWDGLGPTMECTTTAGVRALFSGESGTGKTFAAAHVATELGAPLYRVDLSAVMNKYVGESEKNLSALMDQAEATDVVLLFDEADALFGRRSDAGETGERYANMLTNFLLTRLETHPGIVILTTNARHRIDSAFRRRLDAVLEFPLPDFEERLGLWRAHLGGRAPSDGFCAFVAAHADLAGGYIRNAVIAAAASSPGPQPIGEDTLVRAIEREYRKLGRSLPAALRGAAPRLRPDEGVRDADA